MSKWLWLCAILFCTPVFADTENLEDNLYWYKCEGVRVIDADTHDCSSLSLGFDVHLRDIRFRWYGINAYETRGPEKKKGLAAKQWLVDLIEGKTVLIKSILDGRGKYGRLLGVVYFEGVNLNEEVVRLGHGIHQKY